MSLEEYVVKQQKRLRCGYTTGTCAALAAKAAAQMLLTQQPQHEAALLTPKGIGVQAAVQDAAFSPLEARCAIQKDSGDDPDVTHGVLVYATVRPLPAPGIVVDGGEGVGRVTRKGLEQPVGAAAINRVPRQMIQAEVQAVCDDWHYEGGMEVIISIPQGVELAARTFNPRLGIEGGISVLGTSGIVEPMSEKALTDSIRIELRQLRENGVAGIILTPGNYGQGFLGQHPSLAELPSVKCSNFIGDALDFTVELGFKQVLAIGHIGKFVKLAAGIMNTHSRYADGRMEVLAAHGAALGLSADGVAAILGSVTTDEALTVLESAKLLRPVMDSIMQRIAFHLNARVAGQLEIEAGMFDSNRGLLGVTKGFDSMINRLNK